ncbi:small secreted protein [Xylariaceae sp. FL0804]|nr:small secreted protein [Xylariaceae sp. FL0804]
MQLSTSLIAAILSATASLAAPTASSSSTTGGAKSMAAAAAAAVPAQWTIVSMRRVCDAADTSCAWHFAINNNDNTSLVTCSFTVAGAPASQTASSGNACGQYTVGTGWSGQFGAGQGFTTLSVVDRAAGLIAYPSYGDKALVGGKVVKPDASFKVQALS